jgi:hypothetical protein
VDSHQSLIRILSQEHNLDNAQNHRAREKETRGRQPTIPTRRCHRKKDATARACARESLNAGQLTMPSPKGSLCLASFLTGANMKVNCGAQLANKGAYNRGGRE